jgi:hypothetical protein
MDYDLLDLTTINRSYGRGVVFHAPRWDPTEPLALTHLGDTEGDIAVNTNPEIATLTLPELTGPAGHEGDYTGENPVVEIPLFLAEPALYAIISPSGSAHAGRSARGAVAERTLVIFPEQLFTVVDGAGIISRHTLAFAGGVWTLNGQPLDAAREALLGLSIWLWRGFFNRTPRRFLGGAGDARKQIETASFQGLHHPDMPEGHHLYTTGDPADAGINLEGGS